jgi:hypothetical protein
MPLDNPALYELNVNKTGLGYGKADKPKGSISIP